MNNKHILAITICLVTQSSFSNDAFVKPRKQRSVSLASLKEESATLMADLLELSQDCLHRLVSNCSNSLIEIQKSITKTMRSWISDDDSSLSSDTKAELISKREHLIALKKRFQKIQDEITRLGNELQNVKAELKEFEATC